jgi:hypothetical protein
MQLHDLLILNIFLKINLVVVYYEYILLFDHGDDLIPQIITDDNS